MPVRDNNSSRWFIPLFAGTEITKRKNLQYDPGDMNTHLPGPLPWQLDGLLLWLDAGSPSTVKHFNNNAVYRWIDRSGLAHDGTQVVPAKQPIRLTNPAAINFET